jgi:hypothetical protein
MSREGDINALRFTETIPPLALAPLAGLAVLACASLPRTGPDDVLIVTLYMAPFCYGAAALFVLLILAIWPAVRVRCAAAFNKRAFKVMHSPTRTTLDKNLTLCARKGCLQAEAGARQCSTSAWSAAIKPGLSR